MKSQRSSPKRETLRTTTAALGAGLFGATVLGLLNWSGPLLAWVGNDVIHIALTAAAVVVDTVAILTLIGLGAMGEEGRDYGYVPVRRDGVTVRRRSR